MKTILDENEDNNKTLSTDPPMNDTREWVCPSVGTTMYDAETNNEVVITEAMIARNHAAKRKLYHGFLLMAEGFVEIRDERLYLADGCTSFNEWIAVVSGMSRQKVFNYVRIIDKYANQAGLVQLSPIVEQLGVSKLLEAIKLPKTYFERFKRTGELETSTGEIWDSQTVAQISVRQFREAIHALRAPEALSSDETSGTMPTRQIQRQQQIQAIFQDIEQALAEIDEEKYGRYYEELQAFEARILART